MGEEEWWPARHSMMVIEEGDGRTEKWAKKEGGRQGRVGRWWRRRNEVDVEATLRNTVFGCCLDG